MTLHLTIPGADDLSLEHLVLHVNGTPTDHREPIIAAPHAVERLRDELEPHILSRHVRHRRDPRTHGYTDRPSLGRA